MSLFRRKNNRDPESRKRCCAGCGVDLSLLRRSQIEVIDGMEYCDVCAMNRKSSGEKTAVCSDCGRTVPKAELHSICGKQVCCDCRAKYAGNPQPLR
jgi:hypothetical protein